MIGRLTTEFARYFSLELTPQLHGLLALPTTLFSLGKKILLSNRTIVSEIIPGRVFLSSLPQQGLPFTPMLLESIAKQPDAALVVSCVDSFEIAASNLLMQPESPLIRYHWLAMQDETAQVGAYMHLHDTLQLMSHFANLRKPIHIHCREGVGRSAMMTATHLAHRYLLGDAEIQAQLCPDTPLNSTSENYIHDLYQLATEFVQGKRNVCQFNSAERNRVAITILTELNERIQTNTMAVAADESYQFIADIVQSAAYKKLVHYYYNAAIYQYYNSSPTAYSYMTSYTTSVSSSSNTVTDSRHYFKEFCQDFVANKAGWYHLLVSAVTQQSLPEQRFNPLQQFCQSPFGSSSAEEKISVSANERLEMLSTLLDEINRLSEKYPNGLYSKQALAYRQQLAEKQRSSLRVAS